MNTEDRIDLYDRAKSKWGEDAQIEMAQEEATELALACRKFIRQKTHDNLKKLASEMADVEIMLEQLTLMFPEMSILVTEEKEYKLNRLDDRLSKGEFESDT